MTEKQINMEEKCKHENVTLVKTLIDTHLCFECKTHLTVHEIEIFNQFYEIGGFCDNEKCKRYLLLVI